MSRKCYECGANYTEGCLACNKNAIREIEHREWLEKKSENSAVISECGLYRYSLSRTVGPNTETAVFIMLNPSTADASKDDATIRRCKAYALAFGCGRLVVVNLFAYRTKSPKEMKAFQGDTVGPDNYTHVQNALNMVGELDGGVVICAWGNHGSHEGQNETMLGWIDREGVEACCLDMNKDASNPKHPLYLKNEFRPIPYGEHQEISNA